MLLSNDFKEFATYVCPVITMIGVLLILVITIHINKDMLMESLICVPQIPYRANRYVQYR